MTVAKMSPVMSVGGVIGFDLRGGAARGLMLRGGIQPHAFFDAAASVQFWPGTGRGRGDYILAITAEAAYHPGPREAVIHPYILFGVGHFNMGRGYTGLSGSLGLGFNVPIVKRISVQLEGIVFSLGGGVTGETRAAITYSQTPPARRQFDRGSQVGPTLMWLAAFTGPWRATRPAYGVTFGGPIADRYDITTTFAVAFWEIPNGSVRGYEWDTGSFWALPAVEWRLRPQSAVYLIGGPATAIMFEGPDAGFRGGVHAGVGWRGVLGWLQGTVSASGFWLIRTEVGRGADQRGLLLRAGVGI